MLPHDLFFMMNHKEIYIFANLVIILILIIHFIIRAYLELVLVVKLKIAMLT